MHQRLVLGCLLGLMACGGGGDPESGTWEYLNETTVSNTCGIPFDSTAGDFILTNNGDGTLTIDPQDGTEVFECTLSGGAFSCPERAQGESNGAEVVGDASGEFTSSKAGFGEQHLTLSCTDEECSNAAALFNIPDPCDVVVSFDIAFVE